VGVLTIGVPPDRRAAPPGRPPATGYRPRVTPLGQRTAPSRFPSSRTDLGHVPTVQELGHVRCGEWPTRPCSPAVSFRHAPLTGTRLFPGSGPNDGAATVGCRGRPVLAGQGRPSARDRPRDGPPARRGPVRSTPEVRGRGLRDRAALGQGPPPRTGGRPAPPRTGAGAGGRGSRSAGSGSDHKPLARGRRVTAPDFGP